MQSKSIWKEAQQREKENSGGFLRGLHCGSADAYGRIRTVGQAFDAWVSDVFGGGSRRYVHKRNGRRDNRKRKRLPHGEMRQAFKKKMLN